MSERQRLTPANAEVVARLCGAEPVLVDVRPAGDALPGMTAHTVLTSGPPLPWREYFGGQRAAIIGGALFEGLATDAADADQKLADGRIRLGACHDHGCVGSLAGIYTASMPVLVVENRAGGSRGHCNLFEGPSPARLNYGVYNEQVRQSLLNLRDVIGPALGEAIRGAGGIPLRPIMRRALHMGDELHSRNAAATLLFGRELSPAILALAARQPEAARQLLGYLGSDYVFLRVSMAASKATADAGHGVEGSSVVSAMAFSCREFGIRVSGLGDTWFRAPMPKVEGKFFPGFTVEDVEYMGGESVINETVGLGGFAQAAAFALQEYQGGSPDEMVAANLAMYRITLAEHPELKIPYLGFRGVPVGIDVQRVLDTGVVPVMDIGLAGRKGGQIGAGLLRAPLDCFRAAADALARRPRLPRLTRPQNNEDEVDPMLNERDLLASGAYGSTRRPALAAETLPPLAYTSDDFYRREVERIFLKEWNFMGRADLVPNPGDYFAVELAGVPIIVVRGQDGVVRAFANHCRHRGSALVDGEGNCKAFKCPYHSWVYGLDGRLLGAPEMQRTESFDPNQYGLIPVKLETWGGFLFVNFDPGSRSLPEFLGDLPERCASYHLEDFVCTRRKTFEIACNWKLFAENAMEEYHIATVHRQTIQKNTPVETHAPETPGGEYAVLYSRHEGTMALLKGDAGFPRIPTLQGKPAEGTYFVMVYPSTMFGFTTDCCWYLELRPHGPHRTTLVHGACFPRATAERADFAEVAARYYKRWDKTADEDIKASEWQHLGLNSPLAARGRFSYREVLVHEMDNWYLDRVLGTRPA